MGRKETEKRWCDDLRKLRATLRDCESGKIRHLPDEELKSVVASIQSRIAKLSARIEGAEDS